jgi:hypothetical protein
MHDHFIDSIEAKWATVKFFAQALRWTQGGRRRSISFEMSTLLFLKKGLNALEQKFYESKRDKLELSQSEIITIYNSKCVGFVFTWG